MMIVRMKGEVFGMRSGIVLAYEIGSPIPVDISDIIDTGEEIPVVVVNVVDMDEDAKSVLFSHVDCSPAI